MEEQRKSREMQKEVDDVRKGIQRETLEMQRQVHEAECHLEEKTHKITLPEFLNACHVNLHLPLTVQPGRPTLKEEMPQHANIRLRPESIKAWEDVHIRMTAIWDELMASDFSTKRCFPSDLVFQNAKNEVYKKPIASFEDLGCFVYQSLHGRLTQIIKQLYNHADIRERFNLKGSTAIENHSESLQPAWPFGWCLWPSSPESMRVLRTGNQPQRSTQSKEVQPSDPADISTADANLSGFARADQFCVYNVSRSRQAPSQRVPAFLIEFKAPHELTLGHIIEGLHDMKLEHIVQNRKQDCFRRIIAAVITQAFSYMVRAGLEYGCICTGEACIFLRIPDDPRLVYYYLSVPKADVGEETGWTPDGGGENRLHLTAVGQMLAFTLLALKTPSRGQQWRNNAAAQLKRWEIAWEDLLSQIPKDKLPSSKHWPPRQNGYYRISRIKFQLRPEVSGGGSSRVSHEARNKTYCTQKCLRGLLEGGLLDQSCLNAREHGGSHHEISRRTFIKLMRQQLACSLDTNCESLNASGCRGALFKVRLASHGYTLVAKGTLLQNVHHLQEEAAIYKRLRPIRGVHVPVHLGNLHLAHPFYLDGLAIIVHVMFVSFSGVPILPYMDLNPAEEEEMIRQTRRSIHAIHELGVLHNDLGLCNILWNTELGCTIVIDFERSEIVEKERSCLFYKTVSLGNGKSVENPSQRRRISRFEDEMFWAMLNFGVCNRPPRF